MEEIRTKDVNLAAFLHCDGVDHIRMEMEDSVYWVFEDTDEVAEVVIDFIQGKCRVEPSKYAEELFQTKNKMFDFMRNSGVDVPRRHKTS